MLGREVAQAPLIFFVFKLLLFLIIILFFSPSLLREVAFYP